MKPQIALPISDEFYSVNEYVEALLDFASTSYMFQILCGGIHILDAFTSDPGLFQTAIPEDWQGFLVGCEPMALLDFLIRDNLDSISSTDTAAKAPASFIRYVKDIRKFSLRRSFSQRQQKLPILPRNVALGMNAKKIHEVTNFADYVDKLADSYAGLCDEDITHFIDFGSGQNYLGRTLASAPYNRHVVAVESLEHNIASAKNLDVQSGLAETEKVLRNKKAYQQILDSKTPLDRMSQKVLKRVAKPPTLSAEAVEAADMRPKSELQTKYVSEAGKGTIHYVEGKLETGDLSEVLRKVQDKVTPDQEKDVRLMAISIHSCGNLSHYGIRSIIMNPSIRAIAIVGCCYNLMTEKLGPPTNQLPYLRQTTNAVNRRVIREEERRDPQGFPLSERLSTHNGGLRLNVTARMLACQSPENWNNPDSSAFFSRHFFRAVLQKVFLDRGVISRVCFEKDEDRPQEGWKETPFNMSTNPVVIGSLRKHCYTSWKAYARGAVTKLTTNPAYNQYSSVVQERMADMTDEEIDEYGKLYAPRMREMSSIWSLMSFSAGVTESLIVTDRLLFLQEHPDIVQDSWVEAVFNYRESPRNLVVVGIKKTSS